MISRNRLLRNSSLRDNFTNCSIWRFCAAFCRSFLLIVGWYDTLSLGGQVSEKNYLKFRFKILWTNFNIYKRIMISDLTDGKVQNHTDKFFVSPNRMITTVSKKTWPTFLLIKSKQHGQMKNPFKTSKYMLCEQDPKDCSFLS